MGATNHIGKHKDISAERRVHLQLHKVNITTPATLGQGCQGCHECIADLINLTICLSCEP